MNYEENSRTQSTRTSQLADQVKLQVFAVPRTANPPSGPSIQTSQLLPPFLGLPQIVSSSSTKSGAKFLYSNWPTRRLSVWRWPCKTLNSRVRVNGPWTRQFRYPSWFCVYSLSRWMECALKVSAENRKRRAFVGRMEWRNVALEGAIQFS